MESEDIGLSQRDVHLIPQEVQQQRVRLLDAVDRPARNHEAELAQIDHRPAVTTGEADRQRAAFADAPDVEMPSTASSARASRSICWTNTCEKSASLPTAVSSAVSAVSASAGKARRFSTIGCWNSTATCCASQA